MENNKTISDLANNLNGDLSTADKKKYYLQLINLFFEEGSISTLFISKLNNIDCTVELGDQQLQLKLHLIKLWIFIIKWNYKSCEKNITQIKPNIAISEDKIAKGYFFYMMACFKYRMTKPLKAIHFSEKGLKLLNENTNKKNEVLLVFKLYLGLYTYSFDIDNLEKAVYYYNKAIQILAQNNLEIHAIILTYNHIMKNIMLEQFDEASLALEKLESLAVKINSAYCTSYYILAKVELSNSLDGNYESSFKLLKDNELLFTESNNTFVKLTYLDCCQICSLNLNRLEDAYMYCEQLANIIKHNYPNQFTHSLLEYLFSLISRNVDYLSIISSNEAFSFLNINNSIEKLCELLIEESKKSNKAVQIGVYNLIATHFKINGNYKKALKYIEYNLDLLQNFSPTNFNVEIKGLIQNHKTSDKLKNKEQQLKKQTQLSNYFKAFSTTAAHDLKAPLQTIAGFSNLIESSYISLSDEKAEKYLNLIIETSDNMSKFIDELILVNSEKDNVASFKTVLLKDLIKTVELNIKYLYAEKKYTITILKPGAKLFARKVTLEIILQNLITNSIKYAKANSPAEIVIDINEQNVISVKDNGKGISPLIQDKIFTPFFKADKESKLGNGIGLTTCKKLIEANNGKIWLESEPGKGSTFFFTMNVTKQN